MSYLKQLDDQAWPIVYARFEGPSTVEGFAEYAAWLETLVARARAERTRFITISDTRGGLQVTPDVRRYIGQWVAGLAESGFTASTVGTIVVLDSAIVRGVMTAISWVSRAQMADVSTQATVEGAWQQAIELASAAGLRVPARPTWAQEKIATR